MSHPVLGPGGRSSPGMGAIIGGVVALIVIAVGAYFMLRGSDGTDVPSAQPGIPAPMGSTAVGPNGMHDAADEGTGGAADGEPAGTASGQGAIRPGDEARALIAELRAAGGHIDLHQVHVRAVRFTDANQPVDAYLLWFFAAREGHGPSAFVLGEMYDPEFFDAAASGAVIEQADPAQAMKWYQRALNAGEAMADERIAALMQRIERAAAEGDDDARRLLLAR
ncbi:MAG: hypothetical protein H6926_06005 [Chromatiales bacterium]|nr:hypothetical protein [Gammaproteobacteria bacterium]MCP5352723.1 hypothetical protein [Chromatiales bacterium]